MITNIGKWDRLLRLIVGLLLISFAIPVWFPATGWNWIGWIGLVPFITAMFGVCPLYSVLGISSWSHRQAN